MAHLYGVTLYYLTNWVEGRMSGVVYSRPEVLYYWIYYVGFNAPWVIVPAGMFERLKHCRVCVCVCV